ncbi:MAG TPA: NAD(P)-dependent alcohol dehydrogenase [Thermodesulfovibrionales bacterium]|nr:NAD(P)-dependent alcohol dehydrogenase [Thermodesulfovibrionales bacterium]
MKAFEIRNGFGIDNLTLVERADLSPGCGHVVVRVRAVSLNYRDLLTVKGLYNPKIPLPFVPFSDGAGDVVAVGEGVSRVKTGDRVAGIFMQKWLAGELNEDKAKSALGGGANGMLAEYVALHEEGVVHVPDHLSYEEAATLPCAAVTAWHAVVESGLRPGESVLLLGTGGVSLFALQFALMVGARTIITSRSDEKLAKAKKLGAMDIINYQSVPDWGDRVRELTNGAGVDLVVEVGGAGTLPQSLRAVRMGGRISLIGVLTGSGAEINPRPIIMKKVCVQGIFVGSREMFEAMNRSISLHKSHPVVDRVFPFEDAREALRYIESGAHFGKICVRVD